MIADIHVNIVDLLENMRTGEAVHKFPNVEALSKYTLKTGRIFPQDDPKAEGILQVLLRFITKPESDKRQDRIRRSQQKLSRRKRIV